jgi:hypothetical protein
VLVFTAAGAGRGLLSLTRHLVGGTLTSLSGFSASVRRNLESLSPVRGSRRQRRQPSGGLVSGLGKGLLKVVTVPISGALDVVYWTSEQLITTTGVNREYAHERLDYGEEAPGAECRRDVEGYFRERLNFPRCSYVGQVPGLYALNGPEPGEAVTVVLAGDHLYCLSGGSGSEKVIASVALAAVVRWRHLRNGANSNLKWGRGGSMANLLEVHMGGGLHRLWLSDEHVRLVRAYLGRWISAG